MAGINKRKLGSSDIEIGELTVGTWGLCADAYGQVFDEQRTGTLERALSEGIVSFDMSPNWGPDGLSERAVASAVGSRRGEVVYITRAGYVPGELGLFPAFGPDELRAQCEASLKRLQTDHIDILLLEHPSIEVLARDEVRGTLDALVSEGKLRTWGVSTSHVDDARAAIVSGAKALCVPFNMLQPELVWDLSSECAERGVGVLARSPLLHGLLTGRWSEQKRFMPDDHRMHRWTYEALAARVRQSKDLRNRLSPTSPSMLVLALQFVLAHPIVSSMIVGPGTPAQVSGLIADATYELNLVVPDMQFIYNSVR